jgi:hypothetical protein
MRKFIITFALLSAAAPLFGQQSYYPARDHWEQRPPAQLGFDARRLSDAVAYAKTLEHPQPTDSAGIAAVFIDEAPYNTVIGPWVEKRGRNSGLVIRGGYIAAEWGDTRKVDMTFSATKSYLSTVAGLAFDAGMIRSVLDTVGVAGRVVGQAGLGRSLQSATRQTAGQSARQHLDVQRCPCQRPGARTAACVAAAVA